MAGALGVWGENLCIKCTVKRNTGMGLAAALCPVKLKVQSIVIRNQLFGDLKNMMEGLLNTLHFPKHLSPGFPGVCPQDHCSHEERIIVACLGWHFTSLVAFPEQRNTALLGLPQRHAVSECFRCPSRAEVYHCCAV